MDTIKINQGYDKNLGVYKTNSTDFVQYVEFIQLPISISQILAPTKTKWSESSWIDCSGKSRAVIKLLFSDSSDSEIQVIVKYKAYNDEVIWWKQFYLSPTKYNDPNHSGWVIGEGIIVDTYGCKAVGAVLASAPAHNISIYGGA